MDPFLLPAIRAVKKFVVNHHDYPGKSKPAWKYRVESWKDKKILDRDKVSEYQLRIA